MLVIPQIIVPLQDEADKGLKIVLILPKSAKKYQNLQKKYQNLQKKYQNLQKSRLNI